MNIYLKLVITIIQGTFLSAVGVLICYLMLPGDAFEINPTGFIDGFARRWDGSCHGWTQTLAIEHIKGDLKHWWAYCTMSVVIATRHPITERNFRGYMTIALTSAFIMGCGITHLVDVYCVFDPRYIAQGFIKNLNGNISLVALFYVVYGLLRATDVIERRKARLKQFG